MGQEKFYFTKDSFEVTIIDNGIPDYAGLKRKYVRKQNLAKQKVN